MPPKLSRAQQRFLGLVGSRRSRTDAEAQPPMSVHLPPGTQTQLAAQLQVPGHFRGGPVFGTRYGGEITATYAAPSGYACLTAELRHHPLLMDENYVLGWSDCLITVAGEAVDWVGQWFMAPDNRPGTLEDHLWVLREAGETALVDEEHILLFVGVSAERVEYSAYKLLGGKAEALPITGTPSGGA